MEESSRRAAIDLGQSDLSKLTRARSASVGEREPLEPDALQIRCFHSLDEASHLRNEVNALNRESRRPDPFSSFEFLENYSSQEDPLGKNEARQLWLLAAFEAEELVGFVVLMRVEKRIFGFRAATLRFFATRGTDRPHVVVRADSEQEVTAAIYRYLMRRRRDWDVLELYQQDDASSLFPPPAQIKLFGSVVREWPSMENCTIANRWDRLQDYFLALPKKFRSNLRRQLRKLAGLGRLELLSSSDPSVTPALLELYLVIETHSWKVRGAIDLGQNQQRIRYIRGLLEVQQPMRISIQVLLLDGYPIAGLICGIFMGTMYALHIVYDERLHRFAPGSAILLFGMRQLIRDRLALLNLLSGFGYYKAHWLGELTATRIGQIYRPASLPYWHRLLGDARRAMVALVALERPGKPRRFNLLRREEPSDASAATLPAEGGVITVEASERIRVGTHIARVQEGPHELLSCTELNQELALCFLPVDEDAKRSS
jgi:CelD/BcsL family acetyltransferase involved in cellulose biosynthesis